MININNNNNDHFPHTHWRNVVRIDDQSLLLGEESLRQPVTSHHESNMTFPLCSGNQETGIRVITAEKIIISLGGCQYKYILTPTHPR